MEKKRLKGVTIFCWLTILFVFSISVGICSDKRKGVKFTEGFLMPMVPENAQSKEFPIPEPYDLDELYEITNEFCKSKRVRPHFGTEHQLLFIFSLN